MLHHFLPDFLMPWVPVFWMERLVTTGQSSKGMSQNSQEDPCRRPWPRVPSWPSRLLVVVWLEKGWIGVRIGCWCLTGALLLVEGLVFVVKVLVLLLGSLLGLGVSR
jgi:hypothetical protein